MKKQITVSLFLLICTILADGFTLSAIAIPTIAVSRDLPTNIAAEAPALSKAALTLQDLPPGFKDISAQGESFKKAYGGFKVESEFTYQKGNDDNPLQLQLLFGATMQLPTQSDRSRFDAFIRQGEVPQELTKFLNESQFANLTSLSLGENIGETSSGWVTKGKINDIPIRLEIAVFRRGNLGAMLMSVYVEGESPSIAIADAARKLDSRIVELVPPPQNQPQ